MVKFTGCLDSSFKAPFIYFIFSLDVLYIGETQSCPVTRWSSHLSTAGSFRNAVIKKCDEPSIYFENFTFYAFECTHIANNFDDILHKTATQAVEHELHCIVCRRPSLFKRRYKLISDTVRTAPRRFCEYDFIRDYSQEVIDNLVDNLLE